MSRIEIPITPSVLKWAIDESGLSPEEIAAAAHVSVDKLQQWLSSKEIRPTLTQTRKLATKLHRPLASFLLPSPPASRPLGVQFRHPADDARDLNSTERRYLRRARRFQEMLSWIAQELGASRPNLPRTDTNNEPGLVASQVRSALGISASEQLRWSSSSEAFDLWREALERSGIAVFLFSMGDNSCQGFSMWDEYAPILAINTAWNEEARIFTMFHELGHLISRTSSACLQVTRHSLRTDPIERWCERFAAEVLLPRNDVQSSLYSLGWRPGQQVSDLSIARTLARRFKVSARAAVIRIIELQAASWQLYDAIPPLSDSKQRGGGGRGRNRRQIREDQLGERTAALVVTAVEKDVLDRWQAVELLDVPDAAFDGLAKSVRLRTQLNG